ncbi:hypothetical protein DAPPUDRAFT_110171 [Daphnia pulex]|uniref:Uncharacterized protein n=1 Tax=Daphnia pulex TaxID=6669 RepID=E9H5Q2_DAPPU|nr:hypothetical protein DAPPUDRAFT_110171 [Daphnia pulex]|eukprot:EFX72911.1 hypothetical protein DAPPUDRAFT_110171 [Daphnia pulex]
MSSTTLSNISLFHLQTWDAMGYKHPGAGSFKGGISGPPMAAGFRALPKVPVGLDIGGISAICDEQEIKEATVVKPCCVSLVGLVLTMDTVLRMKIQPTEYDHTNNVEHAMMEFRILSDLISQTATCYKDQEQRLADNLKLTSAQSQEAKTE